MNKVKHKRAHRKSLEGRFLLRIGLDTTLDCIELTRETIQREVLYIQYSVVGTPQRSP